MIIPIDAEGLLKKIAATEKTEQECKLFVLPYAKLIQLHKRSNSHFMTE